MAADGVATQSTQQEWPSLQDSERSQPQDQSITILIAALKTGSPASGNQVAQVLEAIVESYDSRLRAQQYIIKTQQEEIAKVHKQTAQNRADIMSIVEQTNTKLKEHLTKLNDKVKKIKRDNTGGLSRSRTTTYNRATTRGSTMALGSARGEGPGAASFCPKDSIDSQTTSGYDESPTKTGTRPRDSNPFRIAGTEETEDDEEPNNNRPPSEGEQEHTFDIDEDPQAFHASGSNDSKTPKPDMIGRGAVDEDQSSSAASPRASPAATAHHGIGGLALGSLAQRAEHMAEEAMGMVRVPTMMSTLSSDDDDDENILHEGKLIAVTSNMLDKGDMYRSNSSVWDAMFFIMFPAVGPACSILVIICWAINIAMQLAFIYIVEVMLKDDRAIGPDVLEGLLRFRLGAAHHADFADRVSQNSMASQVCMQEAKLHLAGGQQDLYANISKFSADNAWLAETLVMLIQFLWASTVMRDINNTVTIFRGLKGILRSRKSTRLYLADLQDSDDEDENEQGVVKTKSKKDQELPDAGGKFSENSKASKFYGNFTKKSGTFLRNLIEQDHGQDEDEVAHSNLVSIMKVVRWTRVWYGRFYSIILLVCIPKIILAGVLWWVGANWLAHTISLTELILNGVALAFVLDFDECIFDIFVPRRVKILVNNLEPLPLTRNAKQGSKISVVNSTLKISGALIVLMSLYVWMEPKIFWQLRQAENVLCQGETDFIYTVNPATGLVHVAKTPSRTEWTQSEYTIAGVARPPLYDPQNTHWQDTDITSEMFSHSATDKPRAVLEPRAESFAEAEATDASFQRIVQMSVWSVADAAASLPCEDLAENLNVEAAITELRMLTGNPNLNSCSDVPTESCSDIRMTQLRSLCPKTCECDSTFRTTGTGRVGFFGTPFFGCPTQCSTFRAAENEIKFLFDVGHEDTHLFIGCDDFKSNAFAFLGGCSSTNKNDAGVVTSDFYFWDCNFYEWSLNESVQGDDNVCQQGTASTTSKGRDDVDFTASDMCCACGGGKQGVVSSADCWDKWTPDCTDMPREKLAWFRYVRGLFQYLYSKPGFADGVRNVVKEDYAGLSASDEEGDVIVQSITLGWFFRMLATANTWEIAPGIPHPRGLTGCDFLASFEVTALLNLDLCNPGEGTSIKFFCPSACQCTTASLLSECPAGCVFDCGNICGQLRHVHPWYSGLDYVGQSTDGENASFCEDLVFGNATNKCPPVLDDIFKMNLSACSGGADEDFDFFGKCCACGGGSVVRYCHDADTLVHGGITDANGENCHHLSDCGADDDDFTASEMCCNCSGGNETAGVEFTIRINGIDLDSLSMAQQSKVASTLKDIVLGAVLETDRSPSSTIHDVQMELRNGSIMAPTRILFRQKATGTMTEIVEALNQILFGSNFSSSVVDAIGPIAGPENNASQLTAELYGPIVYGGVEEGSPLVVPSIAVNCTCDCTYTQDNHGKGCDFYHTVATDSLTSQCSGLFDDSDFTASDMCCACEGYSPDDAPPTACVDKFLHDGQVDDLGYDCEMWSAYPDQCDSVHDNEDFTASFLCCACGGGEQRTCADTVPKSGGVSAKDSEGRDCRYWDVAPENWLPYCSSFDDDDFTAADFCCACGGGQQLG